MNPTHEKNVMAYGCHKPCWSLRHDKGVSDDSNDQRFLSVDLSLVSMKP